MQQSSKPADMEVKGDDSAKVGPGKGVAGSGYGARSGDLMALVNTMRALGAQYELDLPSIIFCGNQSAGKSSLLEAISGIPPPRTDGTTTRCACEFRLTHTNTPKWECKLALRWEYDDVRQTRIECHEDPFGPVLDKPDGVDVWVWRAQRALLNPGTPATQFMNDPLDPNQKNPLEFTRNIVIVCVNGPEVCDLTLIDLPGLIKYMPGANQVYVKMVEDLVIQYISKPNAIIATTLSCKEEMEMCQIKALAEVYDPAGARTVGVLTKPDTIEPQCHQTYLNVLNGTALPLRYGYYMVKNPSKQEMEKAVTWQQKRELEQRFFATVQPWAAMTTRDRLGVQNLVGRLSEVLTKKIEECLPKMAQILDQKRTELTKELDALPHRADVDSRVQIFQLIRDFQERMKKFTCAEIGTKELFNAAREHFVGLWQAMLQTEPILFHDPERQAATGGSRITLADLIQVIRRERGRLLPENLSYDVIIILARKFLEQWEQPAEQCLGMVCADMKKIVAMEINEAFGTFPFLKGVVSKSVSDFLGKLEKDLHDKIRIYLEMEWRFPFTVHEAVQVRGTDEVLGRLRQQFRPDEMKTQPQAVQQQAVQALQQAAVEVKTVDDFAIRQGDIEPVLRHFAQVVSYFQIAARRFSDTVPLTINLLYIIKFTEDIEEFLRNELKVYKASEADLENLLHEDSDVREKRASLKKKLERVQACWNALHDRTQRIVYVPDEEEKAAAAAAAGAPAPTPAAAAPAAAAAAPMPMQMPAPAMPQAMPPPPVNVTINVQQRQPVPQPADRPPMPAYMPSMPAPSPPQQQYAPPAAMTQSYAAMPQQGYAPPSPQQPQYGQPQMPMQGGYAQPFTSQSGVAAASTATKKGRR